MKSMFAILAILAVVAGRSNAVRVSVYSAFPSQDTGVARKQEKDLGRLNGINVAFFSDSEQLEFLEKNECASPEQRSAMAGTNLQAEFFKWCVLAHDNAEKTIYLDPSSPILSVAALKQVVDQHDNVAVRDGDNQMIHGSYTQVASSGRSVAIKMLEQLKQTEIDVYQAHALLVPRMLHKELSQQGHENWHMLHLKCRKDDSTNAKLRVLQEKHLTCRTGYCCSIQDHELSATIMMSQHYVLPQQSIPNHADLPQSFQGDIGMFADDRSEQPFISTISVKTIENNDNRDTPNFYDMLDQENCLPTEDACTKCLREKKGANCHTTCREVCGCYCEKLCHEDIPAKHVAQEWIVTPPLYSRDPTRLVPRIVHQTWFEELTPEKYPNMSRLVESFKRAGWDYRFYSDEDAIAFLERHFPPAVLEAYTAVIPGAFKADLFRYCVLLISGGVYADVDIQLESALDISIPSDAGFMVPIDEPGRPVNNQMCLWNGFIAAAPSHPFLVKAIETVVNQVRNRFTSVDVDATFCPDPELSVLHAYDTLFTAGPCLLGSSLNRVLGRYGQMSHVSGEMHGLWSDDQRKQSLDGTSFVHGTDDQPQHRIPGRTIILHQNKWDMGAHRFTLLEQNLVVAATDLPDSNDRDTLEDADEHEHYSKAHAKTGVYGLQNLYTDDVKVNEDIRIYVDASMHAKKQTTSQV